MGNGVVGAERRVELKHKFRMRIDGIDDEECKFSKMGELKKSRAVVEVHEGGSDDPVKVHGRRTVEPVELTQVAGLGRAMYDWFEAGSKDKREATIEQLDSDDTVLKRWHLELVWCSDFSTGEWDNEADEGRAEVSTLQLKNWDLVYEA